MRAASWRQRFLVTVSMILACAAAVPAAAANLLSNASVEQADATTPPGPQGWRPLIWGAAMQAEASWVAGDAAAGARFVRIEVKANAGEGDASWQSPAVAVPVDGALRVAVRYRATAAVRLLAAARVGATQDVWMLAAKGPASATWAELEGVVEVPPQTTSLRVNLALDVVGSVDADAFVVEVLPAPSAPKDGQSEVLANGSFEQLGGGGLPLGWSFTATDDPGASGSVGSGDAADGQRYVRMTAVADSDSADVRWWSDRVDIAPAGADWVLGLRFRSMQRPYVLVWQLHADGKASYLLLKRLRPALHDKVRSQPPWESALVGWRPAADVIAFRLAVVLRDPGVCDLDGLTLRRADASGDPQGKLRVSFAIDSLNGDVDGALTVIEAAGVPASLYVPSARIEAVGATSLQRLKVVEKRGIEIGIHGENPAQWLTLSPTVRRTVVIRAFERLRLAGLHPHGFAPPAGVFGDIEADAVDRQVAYVRGLRDGVNYPPHDYLDVRVRNVTAATSAADLGRWMEEARRHDGWLVLRYGGVGAAGAIDLARLLADIAAVQAAGAEITSVGGQIGVWKTPQDPPAEEPGGCGVAAGRGRDATAGLLMFVVMLLGWWRFAAVGRTRVGHLWS